MLCQNSRQNLYKNANVQCVTTEEIVYTLKESIVNDVLSSIFYLQYPLSAHGTCFGAYFNQGITTYQIQIPCS